MQEEWDSSIDSYLWNRESCPYIIYQINYVISAAWIFTTHLIILFKMMYAYTGMKVFYTATGFPSAKEK